MGTGNPMVLFPKNSGTPEPGTGCDDVIKPEMPYNLGQRACIASLSKLFYSNIGARNPMVIFPINSGPPETRNWM